MANDSQSNGDVVRRGPYPELTWPAILVGYLLGSVICVSIGYASLILGFSIEGSELAAILGWGVLRGALRRTSIVENNINQTLASAVNGASAGMMFTVPALFILNRQYPGVTEFSPVLMVLACISGGLIGLAFIIPLRRQMIDLSRLAYPGGIAVAAILKSPGAGLRKSMLLLGGAVVSGLVHLIVLEFAGSEDFALGARMGWPSFLNLTFYLSMLTIGVGFLSGRGGLIFGLGGFLCYWVLSPLLISYGAPEVLALAESAGGGLPNAFRAALFRPLGIGILIGAAIGGIVAAAPLILGAIRSMQDAAREGGRGKLGSDELPIRLLYGAIGFGTLALVVIAFLATPHMSLGRALGMALLGSLWIWVAGVIVSECLGRTNWSPLSGMTLIAVTILVFIGSGLADREVIVSGIIVGAAICVAIAQAGDMMLDLKAGYLVGASPRKQQIAQMLATWLGPILVMGLIFVLHSSYELGSSRLPAPQATALAGVIEGILGGDVPAFRYAADRRRGARRCRNGNGSGLRSHGRGIAGSERSGSENNRAGALVGGIPGGRVRLHPTARCGRVVLVCGGGNHRSRGHRAATGKGCNFRGRQGAG